ncbi:Zinc finger protein 292 [Larimichthys crocea]|uniref:Zinc finger protein 292 n=1 Tax=Larimichthys crocea TaxID=215358 RepID=A0A6G0IF87_LARCR|nr:Zinc finger protein 292 [Larimichthys crocea]
MRNICAYAVVIVVKMAEGETEKEYDTRKAIEELRERFQGLTTALNESSQSPLEASLHFCQEFCQVLVEHAGRWKTDEDPLPLLEVYTVAILSFAKAASCLSAECENVPLLLEKLALSCAELLLLLPQHVPGALWEEFQSSMKLAHSLLQESGSTQLCLLSVLAQQGGVWSNTTLSSILSNQNPQTEQVHEYLELEGPTLLNMRIKHLIKMDSVDKAAVLAKMCSEYPGYEGKGNFKQTYLLCICMTKSQEQLMEEIASIDCKDALEMICNLESEGDEKGALCLCSAFLKRQLLQGDVYCAWELTLFWSKLLMRLESSADAFLGHSKEMALLCRSVCHILFLIKVIQNEVGEVGLPVCVEMCIQALKMTTSDHKDSKSTICKTISCLLPTDLEVKRACQLTEFLLQPTIDSYYAVESLYNEPDQKPEEDGSLPVPNSLRCELLLALKTQWPFDPEFWDWKTLKRNCLALMGEEAAIVSSIDTLNDTDEQECYPGSMEPVPITPMVNPTVYPTWGSPNNPSGMMQSDMSQSWSSPPMNNCYPDAFNMHEYPSRGYPHWQADPYQTTTSLPSDRDHSMAAMHGPTTSHAPSDSSLMSQYVSSSLMLDNGGQIHNGGHQYGLMHPESSGDSVDVRKGSASMTSQLDNGNSISTIESLPEGSYHTPYAQSENSCHTQGSSVDIPLKCLSPEAQIPIKATNEIIKTENISTPGYEPMDNSVDGMLSPHSVTQTDFPYEEECPNADCEANPTDEKASDPDVQKGKRGRLSKRTKWPAIIKDGKVICRRCFREFTSTKSLGGHLSKRSQCRPVDEIDLTADLPTSFLDFLNDPHVPDTNGAIFNVSNGDFSQESCSLTTLTSPMVLKQEPQNTNIMDYSNSNLTVSPENQQEKPVELANTALTTPYQEDHLMEISHAFQRLDLIEAAQEKMRSALALEQNVSHCVTATDIEKSKILSKSDDRPPEKVPKPFKCDQDDYLPQNIYENDRAMHQASLPPSKPEIETENTSVQNGEEFNETISKDNEVRCQVKDCSRVFMGITRLVQHYLLLHKFTRDKATAMMASMTIGTFNCDRPECALPFNSVEKYIEHIKNFHKEIAISESGSVDPTFRCEYESCDRVYTTKSNLLRHLIKKHDYVYDPKTSDGRRTKSVGLFPGVNGKENMENKFKVKKKNTKKKDGKSIEHWTSFGKPTLKSHEEASAMCIKKSALQYPCMIIGCDAVERAERSIFKHYTTHGLTERYIEDQRSQFIFCKKYSRARFKDSNKSEGASSSSSEETEPEDSEKPSDQKTDELMDRIGQENSKLSNDDSAESQASTGTEGGIKRGRPRKPAHPTPACPERMQTLRNRSTVNSSRENSNPAEMSTSSVSKGCFVFKPSAKKKKTHKKDSLEDYFSHGCEGAENSEVRFQLCQDLWDQIKSDTEVLQDELNRKILDSLLDFTRKCSSTRQHSDWASQMRASEIPTAALVLGVNVPDHDMTFQSLSELLQQSVSPHVASVQAKECGALKHLMKRVLERLMGTVVTVDDEEEEEAEQTQLHKSVHCSLNTLCDWYNTKTKKSNTVSPGKKRSSPVKDDPQQPPVVVIFKDFEAFNPKVLQDFILICSRYIERLPLMFIFGIATSPSTIQHMLPHSVSSLLCIELFQSLSCTQHLATVIDKLILTPHFPFKLNGKVMQVLISIFLYHDFSVRNFIKGVQLALLEHFHSQPLSALCCKKKEALLNVMQLSNSHLERIRHLPSFKRYVEKQEPQEQGNLLTDDAHLKDVCQNLIKDLRKYHKNYYPVLRCLHTLTSSLPRYPLGKQVRELHLICLEKNVWENEDYQTAMKLLKMLAKD